MSRAKYDLGCLLGLSLQNILSKEHHLAEFSALLTTVIHLLNHGLHNILTLLLPLIPVLHGIVEVFITGNTKNTTIRKLLGQGNNVKVKESNFSLVPEGSRVCLGPSLLEGLVHLQKETLIPLAVDVPMLHGVGHIGSLDQVFNHNGGLAVEGHTSLVRCKSIIIRIGVVGPFINVLAWRGWYFRKGLGPSSFSEFLEVLVHNISGHDRIDNKFTESGFLLLRCTDGIPQLLVFVVEEDLPGQVYRVLLCNAFTLVNLGNLNPLFHESGIRNCEERAEKEEHKR